MGTMFWGRIISGIALESRGKHDVINNIFHMNAVGGKDD